MTEMTINGLPLPAALAAAIEEERWVAPSDETILEQVFTEKPQDPSFYTFDYMQVENQQWQGVATRHPELCGTPDDSMPPGDIDPNLSVLIGDLGYDMPFALDFRTSRTAPRVIYASLSSGLWITVATRIEDLLTKLGLQSASSASSPTDEHPTPWSSRPET
ncbi:hypothetical protein [Nocardia donostiensis]|uniref:SMI1/KNR4 family protein n=1 Tax=Nocardia donostiensis TaxID=1538463 RepID=A0A1W0BEE2_9NOCA|nr:hypothetical protein [Nocardia donostiensis]ONM50608.1 hypothetical protein B0T46_01535 [Nocardia donostiensis]OQS20748.1 hypothetical protein B0T44_08930 [Nocardia donostiensis]